MRMIHRAVALLVLVSFSNASSSKVLICYYGSWAIYRPGNARLFPVNIEADLCTHHIYAFIGLDPDTGSVTILDSTADLADYGGHDGFNKFLSLRDFAPESKFMVAIGGWNHGSREFSIVAGNVTLRAAFVESAVTFLKKRGFDGLDVDWLYPTLRADSTPEDYDNYPILLKELNEAFQEDGFILTVAVGAAESTASQAYNIPLVSQYVDYIHLLAYDLHVPTAPAIAFNAPTFPAAYEANNVEELQLNVNACISYWIDSGADPAKLVLGMSTYGHSFSLEDTTEYLPGSPSAGPGEAGSYTSEAGVLSYYEICLRVGKEKWTTDWSDDQLVPYAYQDDQWVGYDNPKSIAIKLYLAMEYGLAGGIFWAIDLDDFLGFCSDNTYPLIRTAHDILFFWC